MTERMRPVKREWEQNDAKYKEGTIVTTNWSTSGYFSQMVPIIARSDAHKMISISDIKEPVIKGQTNATVTAAGRRIFIIKKG